MMNRRLIALALLALVAGCTVQPLYSDRPLAGGRVDGKATASIGTAMSSIAIDAPDDWLTLEVRNHLSFLFYGGAERPAGTRLKLELKTWSSVLPTANLGVRNAPSSALMQVGAIYNLVDTKTGKRIASGRQTVSAAYDRPRQEHAIIRAAREARQRGAREVAELVRLRVAQDLVKYSGTEAGLQVTPPPTAEDRINEEVQDDSIDD